ncbi:MAG: hypothetical protein KAR47_03810, partial [Planctomycetes bacterium]|nr:hypothetical protein [Planctomycetota bacterium]
MLNNLPNMTARGLFVVILGAGLCLTGLSQAATGYPRSSSQRRDQSPDPQNAERIRITADSVSNNLTKILTIVNDGSIPDTQTIETAATVVREGRLVLNDLQSGVQCKYFMLQAWTSFFQDDAKTASLAAARAYRTDLKNPDARATNIAMSALSGKKPQTQAPPKPRSSASDSGNDYSSYDSGLLSLDIDAIKPDLFERTIERIDFSCLNGTGFSYNSANAGLCLLVWQLPETMNADSAKSAAGARDKPAEPARQQSTENRSGYDEFADGDFSYDDEFYSSEYDDYSDSSGRQGDPFQSQMDA